jgi:hypothetical protein
MLKDAMLKSNLMKKNKQQKFSNKPMEQPLVYLMPYAYAICLCRVPYAVCHMPYAIRQQQQQQQQEKQTKTKTTKNINFTIC